MTPGRELDALVAEKVMGWRKGSLAEPLLPSLDHPNPHRYQDKEGFIVIPSYSSDITAAWEVLTCGKWTWTLEEMDDDGRVSCYLENEDEDIWAHEIALTAPHAICLAALKAYK